MVNIKQKLDWREVSPNHWMRSLDSIESFFHSASSIKTPSGVAHLMVRVGARLPLEMNCTIETIKEAWKTLRYYHPRIASSVVDGKLTYTIPSSQQLEEWLEETVFKPSTSPLSRRLVSSEQAQPSSLNFFRVSFSTRGGNCDSR